MAVQPEARTAFFFGEPDRQLYGFYHAPQGHKQVSSPVLICSPLGVEYDQSHHFVHQLANMLAKAGCPVMRFNYFGTGNSAGEASEVSTAGLLADMRVAIAELCARAGSVDPVIVGIRSGATLTAGLVASGEAGENCTLVLWDGFLERQGQRRGPGGRPGWTRGCGFSRSFIADMVRQGTALRGVPGNRGRTLLVQTHASPDGAAVQGNSTGEHPDIEFKAFPEVSFSSQSQAVPYKVMNYIVQWIVAR